MPVVFLLLLIFITVPLQAGETVEISAWAPADIEVTPADERGLAYADADGNRYYEHPCGMIRKMEVDRLPPPSSDGYIPGTEKVFEFDSDMNTFHSWSMPVDSWVMAIEGDQIIVSYRAPGWVDEEGRTRYRNAALAISDTGEIEVVARPGSPETETVACDEAAAREFGDSAYARCTIFRDRASGEERIILAEGVCT